MQTVYSIVNLRSGEERKDNLPLNIGLVSVDILKWDKEDKVYPPILL